MRETMLCAETGGRVVARKAGMGDRVKMGEILLILNDEQARCALAEASARVDDAKAGLDAAEREMKRSQALFDEGKISRMALEAAETAERRARAALAMAKAGLANAEYILEGTRIKSPFDGILTSDFPAEGNFVQPWIPLVRIIDDHPMKAVSGASWQTASRIRKGMKTFFSCSEFAGRRFPGKILSIARGSDQASGNYAIQAEISNLDSILPSGLSGVLTIVLETIPEAVIVPGTSINNDDNDTTFVWVVEENSTVTRVPVRIIGIDESNRMAVEPLERALKTGTQVVTVGKENLVEGSIVLFPEGKKDN